MTPFQLPPTATVADSAFVQEVSWPPPLGDRGTAGSSGILANSGSTTLLAGPGDLQPQVVTTEIIVGTRVGRLLLERINASGQSDDSTAGSPNESNGGAAVWLVDFGDEADRQNADRLQMLARRFARRGADPELDARIEILNERVRQLIPRVTERDLQKLAEDLEEAASYAAEAELELKELGVSRSW
jgi:hypothetical protein